jgi:hypothetical protein
MNSIDGVVVVVVVVVVVIRGGGGQLQRGGERIVPVWCISTSGARADFDGLHETGQLTLTSSSSCSATGVRCLNWLIQSRMVVALELF